VHVGVSLEDCALVAEALGPPYLDPALLGANIVLSELDGLARLPPSTRLRVPSGATIFITEPTHHAANRDGRSRQAHGNPELERAFPQPASVCRTL
jgi:hypothetical protein